MAYDALGRCVKRTLNGAITYYLYDGEKPILEFDDSGNMVGFNVYGKGVDELIQRGAYGSDSIWHWYFPQQDHEGSVTHLTDENGAIIEKYKYDAFGQPVIYNVAGQVITNSAYNNRFLFTGREWAPKNLGFYEYRARAYHPGLGRFMSEDPKGFDAGDYNLYRYCLDDPINRTDPMGLFGTPPEQSISGGVVDIDFAPGLHSGTSGSSLVTSSGLEAQWRASHNTTVAWVGSERVARAAGLVPITQDKKLQSRSPREAAIEAAMQAKIDSKGDTIYSYNVYQKDGKITYQRSDPAQFTGSNYVEKFPRPPAGEVFIANWTRSSGYRTR